ncbi:hypothetical protein, partial [Actinoplanes siamensis]|uniref:hypothetical protein n=1 Tax=Actinoplanes siamensis TaxID=1223317 RepID=UPI00360E00B9
MVLERSGQVAFGGIALGLDILNLAARGGQLAGRGVAFRLGAFAQRRGGRRGLDRLVAGPRRLL